MILALGCSVWVPYRLLSHVKEMMATIKYKECYYPTPGTNLGALEISL